MSFVPLIERELHVAVRRPATYRIRFLCGVAAMAIAFWAFFVWPTWRPVAAIGRSFLGAVASVGFCGTLLAGIFLTADAVSQEKREGTLGLLYLTDLRAHDIVLGKLAAKAILPLYGLLAMAPTLALSVLVGGITAGEFVRMFLVWANALFVALAVGLLTSTFCWQQRAAHLSAVGALVLLVGAIPALGTELAAVTSQPAWASVSFLLSPSGAYRFAFDKSYQSNPGWFWGALAVNQVLAGLFLGVAWTALLRIRSEKVIGSAQPASGKRPSRYVPTLRRRRSPGLLTTRPVEWLESYRCANPFLLWLWPLVGACLLGFAEVDPLGSNRAKIGFLLFAVVQSILKTWVAAYATYAFVADRRGGALESLLGTSLGVREITSGMLRGFGRRFGSAIVVFCLLDVALAFYLFGQGATESALVLVLAAAMMLLDCYGLFWVGLFQGLVAPSPALALGATLLRILVLPWGWFLALALIYSRSSISEFLVLWVILVPINHLAFLINARASFFRYFRALALKPFAEKNPHIESDWSPINWEDATSPRLGSGRESAHSILQ